MHFRSIAYDAKSKIWSNSSPQTDYFAPDLSIGEIIFHEMRRHPQLIAQISDTEKTILTRENLQMNSMRVASYMRKLRLQQSDIVVYSTTRIIADDEFDPSRELHRIEKYKVTWWRLSPIMVIGLEKTEKFHKTNFASVDYCIIGGDRCPVPVVERFRNRLKAKSVALTYGLSEFGFMVTTNFHLDIKPTSVGCLQCGYKLKILDEQGKILGPNEVGEVLMYSGQYWGGYYGNPEETQRVYDSERWYHTGDMGYVDNDGFLYIIDRKEDMLRYNLSTYFPNEIQNVIEQISDVVEVCVFGLCMDANADIPAAVVVKKKGSKLQAQDVVDYVKEHVEENYKHMDGKVLIVENLIRALGGKINRRVNKEYFLRVMNGN
ncbi:uncharacterized protein Dwil_GK15191 [Drosophila willistoni]|uniref:AMP-dependent synthetase/ligase domain-containing protein n=1 Tax=Drosophila willistoni TaxID=7260 RepID=B4MW39_DROWI|nr:uncharacterized protein Dwil_GK15191 [Drosophila willistoni]